MSRKRKPIARPLADAMEAVQWRGKILCERLTVLRPIPEIDAVKRFADALEDLEASRGSGVQGQLELRS